MIKPNNRALGAKVKQANRASPDGNAPLSPPAAVLLLKGSMSLDSQSSTTPYESSSFATPEGEVLATLSIEQLKLAQGASEEQICPSGVASEHDS